MEPMVIARLVQAAAVQAGERALVVGAGSGYGAALLAACGAQVTALEAAESSTKLALEATQLGYKVGVRVNLDVLNAQTQLYQTQRDLARARYNVLLGDLQLQQASGQLDVGDIDALNTLLAK